MAYKWDNAHEWLFEKASEWTREELLHEFKELALKLDSDTIQDQFQSDMEQDGYFEDEDEEAEEFTEYEEGDYIFDGSDVYRDGKMVIQHTYDSDYRVISLGKVFEAVEEAIKADMEHENYYPAVWYQSDHGNMSIMDLTKK